MNASFIWARERLEVVPARWGTPARRAETIRQRRHPAAEIAHQILTYDFAALFSHQCEKAVDDVIALLRMNVPHDSRVALHIGSDMRVAVKISQSLLLVIRMGFFVNHTRSI